MVDKNLREWHTLFHYATWAYRASIRYATGTTPYQLVSGHEPVLPIELTMQYTRVARSIDLSINEYQESMSLELTDVEEELLKALEDIKA
ncbi:F-box/WD repeat-containing protein pof10 [Bienertia sinuspersici]